jgi:O-antigen/teichoic acid export membrane protein
MLQKLLKNPVIGYITSRYATYAIQFVNSIFIAIYLGPLYLGVWGFISLIIQYFGQVNFGITHAVNTIASIHKQRQQYISQILGNAVLMLCILSGCLGLLFFCNSFFQWGIGDKYNFDHYALYVFLIIVFTYFSALFSAFFRIYGKLFEIAFSQSVFPIATLAVLFFSSKEQLLDNLVYTYVGTYFLSIILFIVRFPIKVTFNMSRRLWWLIQKKGWYLFLYSSSFYFIIITTRSFVSNYYTVTQFGYFTFAFSLANVILMLLAAFTFIIWPKLLNMLSKLPHEESFALLQKLRSLYVSTSHLLVHVGLFLFPYFLLFFEQYQGTFETFAFIALTVVIYTNCFGYQGLLIARERERFVGYLSVAAVVFNLLLCYGLIKILHVGYEHVIFATMITYVIYVFILGALGRKILQIRFDFWKTLADIFPLSISVPYSVSLAMALAQLNKYYFFIPLLCFLILNFKEYKPIKNSVKDLLLNPDKINI